MVLCKDQSLVNNLLQVPLSGESFLKEVHGSIQTRDQIPLVLTMANEKLIDHSFEEQTVP